MYAQRANDIPVANPPGLLDNAHNRFCDAELRTAQAAARLQNLADRLLGIALRDAPKAPPSNMIEREPPTVERFERTASNIDAMLCRLEEELQRLETL